MGPLLLLQLLATAAATAAATATATATAGVPELRLVGDPAGDFSLQLGGVRFATAAPLTVQCVPGEMRHFQPLPSRFPKRN